MQPAGCVIRKPDAPFVDANPTGTSIMQALLIKGDSARLIDQIPETLADGELVWLDCLYEQAREWVEPVQNLTGITVFEDHLLDAENRNHPSYFDSTQTYEMIVFRGLAVEPEQPAESNTIRARTRPTIFFVMPGCLVTVRPPDSRTVPALQQRLISQSPTRQRFPAHPEDLMLRLLNGMVDRYLELRQPMTEQLERWQRRLLDSRRSFRQWHELLEARSEMRKLEQLCEEQLDALRNWIDERAEPGPDAGTSAALSDAQRVRASNVVEHINRVLNHVRRLQDSIETAVQLHFSMTAHRTNETMRALTAITAIFLPLTLITGIFGMNFDSMPWIALPYGFWLTIGLMGLIAVLLIGIFKARRVIEHPSSALTARRLRQRSRNSEDPARPAQG